VEQLYWRCIWRSWTLNHKRRAAAARPALLDTATDTDQQAVADAQDSNNSSGGDIGTTLRNLAITMGVSTAFDVAGKAVKGATKAAAKAESTAARTADDAAEAAKAERTAAKQVEQTVEKKAAATADDAVAAAKAARAAEQTTQEAASQVGRSSRARGRRQGHSGGGPASREGGCTRQQHKPPRQRRRRQSLMQPRLPSGPPRRLPITRRRRRRTGPQQRQPCRQGGQGGGGEGCTRGEPLSGQEAAKSATSAKGASLVTKLKFSPAQLIIMVLSTILYEVLDLDPSDFKPCQNGYFDLNSLPDWARAIISGVPFLGDLFDLIGDKLCLHSGCAAGLEQGGGLGSGFCYKLCPPGYKNDGANMCYKQLTQYPDFEKHALASTLASITKKILMDTGTVPNTCSATEDRVGALCYDKAPAGYVNKAGTIWQECPAGYTDTGVRCETLKDVGAGQLKECPSDWSNDGHTCREPLH
jgi:hypothetical protein